MPEPEPKRPHWMDAPQPIVRKANDLTRYTEHVEQARRDGWALDMLDVGATDGIVSTTELAASASSPGLATPSLILR